MSRQMYTMYEMEIHAEKTKVITSIANAISNGIQREIKVKEQKLATVTSYNHIGAVVSDDGSGRSTSIAQATAALTKVNPVWRDATYILHFLTIIIFMYACE